MIKKLKVLGSFRYLKQLIFLEDPDRPCRVACQDENISHRFYLVNGEDGWFPFGTDCSRGSTEKKAYCISGKCLVSKSNKSYYYIKKYCAST